MRRNKLETTFDIAKKDIISAFENHGKRVFTFEEISTILTSNKDFWRLPKNSSVKGFIDLLIQKTKLRVHSFSFPHVQISRYSWGESSIFSIIQSLKRESYYTHYTAIYLHGITEQIPKSVYLNSEQSPKSAFEGEMLQANIDRAFSRPQRMTSNKASMGDYEIYFLNGKFTNKLGVIEMEIEGGDKVSVTNLERTLIDISVRPSYAGGVFEVLKAYKNAADKVSINKLCSMLKKINYIYPYHQSIGFFMERSKAYNSSQLNLLKRFPMKYDFYLTNQMKAKEYSKDWKIFFPKHF